jgi:UDP-N-acetylmuramate dehydrogenase
MNLKNYNTFDVPAKCDRLTVLEHSDQIPEIVRFLNDNPMPVLILGNGSNILFANDFNGLVVVNRIKGLQIVSESEDEINIEAGAGENWRDFVAYCVGQGWGGVENLADIPGTTGASVVQNIGAYDMETENVIISVTAYSLQTGEKRVFSKQECQFGYRFSIFKNDEYKHLIITHVTYQLDKKPLPITSYKAIQTVFSEKNIPSPTIHDIYHIVKELRKSKLPDETIQHNAGSFFKNPVVPMEQAQNIQQNHPEMPLYPLPDGRAKLAAGWLIEQCGLKGYRKGDAGIHDKQALVLVNYGSATGTEILEVAQLAVLEVWEKFKVSLELEVIIIPK